MSDGISRFHQVTTPGQVTIRDRRGPIAEQGRPGFGNFGLTIDKAGQHVWLDAELGFYGLSRFRSVMLSGRFTVLPTS